MTNASDAKLLVSASEEEATKTALTIAGFFVCLNLVYFAVLEAAGRGMLSFLY